MKRERRQASPPQRGEPRCVGRDYRRLTSALRVRAEEYDAKALRRRCSWRTEPARSSANE
jgi:hypothetical protein